MNRVSRQKGTVLLLAMVLLVAATLVTLISMQGSNLQEGMTSNQNQKKLSELAAESGATSILNWAQGLSFADSRDLSSCNIQFPAVSLIAGADDLYYQVYNCQAGAQSVVDLFIDGFVSAVGPNPEQAQAHSYTRIRLSPKGIGGPEAAYTCYGEHCSTATGSSSNNAIYYDGRDWHLPVSSNCSGANCSGELVNGNSDTTGVYLIGNDAAEAISTGQGNADRPDQIQGNPPFRQTDESITENNISVADWESYIASLEVDVSISAGDGMTSILGSRDNPKIIEITGSGSMQLASNVHSAGILVIDGDIEISPANGTFTFEGLVILKSGARISSGNGTANIFGSVISLSGVEDAIDADLGGNFSLKYSSAAFESLPIENMPGSRPETTLLAWSELSKK